MNYGLIKLGNNMIYGFMLNVASQLIGHANIGKLTTLTALTLTLLQIYSKNYNAIKYALHLFDRRLVQ